MADTELLYKLTPADTVREDAWKTRNQWEGAYVETGKEFISLQTAAQLAGVAEVSFAGRADIKVLVFAVEKMREEADLIIKFEAAESEKGGSGEFAHAYGGPIPYACLRREPFTLGLAGGKHVLTLDKLTGSLAVAAGGEAPDKTTYLDDDASASDDGGEAFDQHRFDCDSDLWDEAFG